MNFGKTLVAIMFAMILSTVAIYSTPLGIIVPAYFNPASGGYWSSLDYAASRVPLIAIMNPDSGPGTSQEHAYVEALASLHQAGGKVVGYVYSSYATRPLTNVESDIDSYLSFYAVDGFFIDEMTDDDNSNHLAYYAAIYQYIKAKGTNYSVTGNPGVNTSQGYLTAPAADCLMVFENDNTNYPDFLPSDWVTEYPAQQFAQISYDVMNSAAMSNDVNLAAIRNAGWIYFTDDALPNPYDTLPSYWTNEVNFVSTISTVLPAASAYANITIDGSFNDWAKVPLVYTAPPGPTNAIQYQNIYLANDQSNLYIRFTLYSPCTNAFANSIDNLFIDAGDNSAPGYPAAGIDSDMLVQWGSGYQEKDGGFNEGGIANLGWQIAGSPNATNFELAISRSAAYASDGTLVFTNNTIEILLEGDDINYSSVEFTPPAGGLVYTFASAMPGPLSIDQLGGNVIISWPGQGVLQACASLQSSVTWTNVPGASSPFVFAPPNSGELFRLAQ